MSSFIELIEDAMQKKLHEDVNPQGVSNAAIEIYPDRPDEYKLTHASSALLIRYAGSRTIERYNGNLTKLEAVFEVTAMTRRYRDGVLHIAKLREILRGFTPLPEIDKQYKFTTQGDGFIKYQEKVWQHYIRFSITLFDPINIEGMML